MVTCFFGDVWGTERRGQKMTSEVTREDKNNSQLFPIINANKLKFIWMKSLKSLKVFFVSKMRKIRGAYLVYLLVIFNLLIIFIIGKQR